MDRIPGNDRDGVNLQLFRVTSLLRRRKLIIASVAFCVMLIFLGGMAVIKPSYLAEATLLIDPNREDIAKLETRGSAPIDTAQIIEMALQNSIQTLGGQRLTRELIEKMNLRSDPDFNPLLDPSYGILHSMLHDLVLKSRKWLPPVFDSFLVPRYAPELLNNIDDIIVARVEKERVINRNSKSEEIRVGFIDRDPARAASLANAYVILFVDEGIARKRFDIEQLSGWINQRVAELKERVRAAEERVENYRQENRLVQGRDLPSVQQITEISSQLTAALAARDEAASKLQQAEVGKVDSLEEVQRSAVIQQLRIQESELARNLAAVEATSLGGNHLKVIQARAQLEEVQRKIANEVARIARILRSNVGVGTKQVDSLKLSLSRAKAAGGQENIASVQLRVLERDAGDAKALLAQFLAHAKLTTEADVQFTEARVISTAIAPVIAHFPNLIMILAMAGIASLSVGVTVALYVDHRNRGLCSMDEIQPELNLPALSLIPWATQPTSLPQRRPWSAYAESMRQLYAALSNIDSSKGSILFTSSVSREGKTTVAVSFARTLAKSDRSVILIDCDMRQPTAHRMLRLPNDKGLVDYLARDAPGSELIKIDPDTGLHFLAAGKAIENPALGLDSAKMRELIQKLAQHYDTIVLDSPPILPVADTKLLARYVDKVVIVARWRGTDRSMVRFAIRLLKGVEIAGVVINGVVARKYALYGMSDSGLYWSRSDRKYYIQHRGPSTRPKSIERSPQLRTTLMQAEPVSPSPRVLDVETLNAYRRIFRLQPVAKPAPKADQSLS